jgi:hypothetical protein
MNEKVIMKYDYRQTFSYLSMDYTGDRSRIELRKQFGELDFVATWQIEGKVLLMVSLFERRELNDCVELPQLSEDDANQFDVLFLRDIPEELRSQREMSLFLYSFGVDQMVHLYDDYCRLEPRNAQISYRIQTFLPFVKSKGAAMTFSHFPFFIPMVRIQNIPSSATVDDFRELVPDLTEFQFLRSRRENEPRTGFMTLRSPQRADQVVEQLNYSNNLLVTRYTDENHFRLLRRHELVVFEQHTSLELMNQFSRFGPVLQAQWLDQFGIGVVQFFRRKDAIRARSDTAVFHDEGTTAIVRELSLGISEDEIIQIFSRFGTIRNLVFRDLSEYHILSVVDITYSRAAEASACKAHMTRQVLDGATLHISVQKQLDIRDWKMSQRNQWAKLENAEDLRRCCEFGIVVDYLVSDGVGFVMFESADSVAELLQHVSGAPITNSEFVFKTGARDLDLIEVPLGKPQLIAVELDPVPDLLRAEQIHAMCAECGEFELFTVPSLVAPDKSRILIYAGSRRLTKRIYTILACHRVDGQLLRPRRLKPNDVQDRPPRKGHPVEIYGVYPVVIVDPLPDDFRESGLPPILADFDAAHVWHENSAVFRGCHRVIIRLKSPKDRKSLLQRLTMASTDDTNLKISLVKPHQVPEPIHIEEALV